MKVRLRHLRLNVRDIETSERFYREVLGLAVRFKKPGIRTLLSDATDSSHCLALFQKTSNALGQHCPMEHTGWQVETMADLRKAHFTLQQRSDVQNLRLQDNQIQLSIYFTDPDGIGVELFFELDPEQWYDDSGELIAEFPYSLFDEGC